MNKDKLIGVIFYMASASLALGLFIYVCVEMYFWFAERV